MAELTVASVMTTRVVTVQPETPLRELVSTMAGTRVKALPVVDRLDRPIGVVSQADLVLRQRLPGGQDSRSHGEPAAELMTTPVRAVHSDEPVTFAAQLLAKAGIRRLFVVNWDSRLVGVVARRDLLRVGPRGDDQLRIQILELLQAAGITPGVSGVRDTPRFVVDDAFPRQRRRRVPARTRP